MFYQVGFVQSKPNTFTTRARKIAYDLWPRDQLKD